MDIRYSRWVAKNTSRIRYPISVSQITSVDITLPWNVTSGPIWYKDRDHAIIGATLLA